MKKLNLTIINLLLIITLSSCLSDKPKDKPIINGTKDFEFILGDPRPNWLEGVSAYDYNEEEILVTVDASDVDLQNPGIYELIYIASDNLNQETKITVKVTILDKDTTPPVITGTSNYTLYVNSTKPDWLEGVVITDNVDSNPILTVDDSDVKMDTIGTYNLIYKGIDSSLNETTITVLVEITEKPIESANPNFPSKPNFGANVSVHDPSVIYADGKYYAFGSHFAVSSSNDLITWTQELGENGHSTLYGNWRNVLSDALNYVGQGASSTWAPGMIKIDDTYYMYYSLSTFGSQRSYIGRVESKNILGPYTNSVEIIKTELGEGPNAIDAEVFFDEDGKLWMIYGSFFGGIYIKELYNSDSNIGLPKENGFGKKIWNGSGTGPEGPYIFYNNETEYYYLMVSHGSLSNNYNMRVARSKNPDGPYLDINNIDVSLNSNGGNKLAGNYEFNGATGYAALGHNSVIKVNNKYIVIYHTRYKQGQGVSGRHNMMANQLLFNKDGWPLLSPSRYAGEDLQEIKNGDLIGEYDIVIHSGGNNESFISSSSYSFNLDGTISNGGTWELISPYYIEFNLNNKWYSGVLIPSWNHYLDKPALSITAVNLRDGTSLWAYKK